MAVEGKARIYKTCIRRIINYTAETKTACLRSRETSRNIRKRYEIQNIVKWIRLRCRHWKVHIDRMGDNVVDKEGMREENSITRRPTGRPPKW